MKGIDMFKKGDLVECLVDIPFLNSQLGQVKLFPKGTILTVEWHDPAKKQIKVKDNNGFDLVCNDFDFILHAVINNSLIHNKVSFKKGDMVKALRQLAYLHTNGCSTVNAGTIVEVTQDQHFDIVEVMCPNGITRNFKAEYFEHYLTVGNAVNNAVNMTLLNGFIFDQSKITNSNPVPKEPHKCNCVLRDLLMNGCKCGGI